MTTEDDETPLVQEVRRLVDALSTNNADDTAKNPHVRRRMIVAMLEAGNLNDAESEIRTLLDSQWKVPENIYLLGILFLLRGQFDLAQRTIDQALELKPWITEVPDWTGALRARIDEAIDREPGWLWPRYRSRATEHETFGLTLSSALSTRFEHADVQLVQVGANDGVSTDPMRGWIDRYGWSALLFEPMAEPFESLSALYAHSPKVTTVNAAIAAADGARTMWTHEQGRHAVSTFVPERNLLRNESSVVPVQVPCRTFESVFDEFDTTRVDVLQIDAEGYDFEILKMFPFESHRPAVVHMEFYVLPLDERLATFEVLEAWGFAWRLVGADLLAVSTDEYADRFGLMKAVAR